MDNTKTELNASEKIISCHGNVNARSAAKMCGVSRAYVYNVWHNAGLFTVWKDEQKNRSYRKYKPKR
jgi:hypothetical protein